MKYISWPIKKVVWLVLALGFLFSCQREAKEVSKGGSSGVKNDSLLKYLAEPVTQTAIGYFKTIEPQPMSPKDTLNVEGFIGFDQRALNTVNTRVTGRIDHLFVKYAGQQIRSGQPLMEIYSPELVAAQRNLLQSVNGREEVLIKGLKEQLINLGMTAAEINKVVRTGKPILNITIYSPYNGISQSPQMTGMAMQEGEDNTDLPIKEGQYVQKGEPVFAIQNTRQKWAILNILNQDFRSIKIGNSVQLFAEANPGQIVRGRVDFIPPLRSENEQTSPVRVYLNNLPDQWKIGTLIRGKITIRTGEESLYIPRSAVNILGPDHCVVWVQNKDRENVFRVRNVKTGLQKGDFIQILGGIATGEKIASDASFMIDNDSYIK